ncbi:MAG: ABC transporter substrate-binding protein [Acidimicrobiia bacterium]|nr:ABC transporter substrate-binding protein [Acidimicrobiia bacterium]
MAIVDIVLALAIAGGVAIILLVLVALQRRDRPTDWEPDGAVAAREHELGQKLPPAGRPPRRPAAPPSRALASGRGGVAPATSRLAGLDTIPCVTLRNEDYRRRAARRRHGRRGLGTAPEISGRPSARLRAPCRWARPLRSRRGRRRGWPEQATGIPAIGGDEGGHDVRPTRRTARALVALVAATGLVAGGCGGGSGGTAGDPDDRTDITQEASGPAQRGGSLAIGLTAADGGWDPVNSQRRPNSYLVANSIFDPLAAYDENGAPQPYLAESIEANEDFTEWTITLRDGVRFHDGTELDADALVDNLEAHLASGLTGQALGPVETVDDDGPLSVVVGMSRPWSTFPHALTFQPGYVASPDQLTSEDAATQPVGTGPFTFEEWVQDSDLTVARNEQYWRDEAPYLDEIVYTVLADTTARSSALDTGDVDMIQSAQPGQILDFQSQAEAGDFQLFVNRDTEVADLIVAARHPGTALRQPHRRRRPSPPASTARTSPRRSSRGCSSRPRDSSTPTRSGTRPRATTPRTTRHGPASWPRSTRPRRARPLSFTISTPSDPFAVQVAQVGQQQLADAGITMEIKRVEQTTLILDAISGNYEATAWTFLGGSHPDSIYPFVHGSNADADELALAITAVDNPAINEALDAARATDDPEAQREEWLTVQSEMASDIGYLYIVHTEGALIARNEVRGVTDWELPDGTPGVGQEGTSTMTYQLWLDEEGYFVRAESRPPA